MTVLLTPKDHSRRCFFRSTGLCWGRALVKMMKEGKPLAGILVRDEVAVFPLFFLLQIN